MKAIVNVDKNWGIGIGNELLNPIPADMKFFRETTTGNVVVMGRKTFLSFPGPKALPKRVNIVITTDKEWSAPDVTVCHSLEELYDTLKNYDTDSVYVIGGSAVYEQLVPLCDTVYVTKVETSKPADKFFPNLDADDTWKIESEGEEQEHNGEKFRFLTYKKA
jgi:dihydrofolate reductase